MQQAMGVFEGRYGGGSEKRDPLVWSPVCPAGTEREEPTTFQIEAKWQEALLGPKDSVPDGDEPTEQYQVNCKSQLHKRNANGASFCGRA